MISHFQRETISHKEECRPNFQNPHSTKNVFTVNGSDRVFEILLLCLHPNHFPVFSFAWEQTKHSQVVGLSLRGVSDAVITQGAQLK